MKFRQHTLNNGLEVVAECNPNAFAASFGFFVRAGSRDETDEISGVSHFLEHMVFKGTPTRTAADVNRELDEIGSHSNAYTSEERTVYYASVIPEYQDQAVELLCDIMRPSLREDDFETEKQVILEEIARFEDQPPYGAYEKNMAAHFGTHPLSRCVLGTHASVSALTAEQMKQYFARRYSPGNIALVASGKVDFDDMVRLAEEHCGSWQPYETQRDTRRADPHQGFELMHKPVSSQEYISQIANGPSAEDADRYAGRILTTVVGDDGGSRMFWELVDPGHAEYASMGTYEFQGTGILMTFLSCAPEQSEANLERLRQIQQKVEAEGITEDELNQAKNKICAHVVLQAERSGTRMFSVGVNWLQRHEHRTVREVVDAYQAVTCEDVARLLERYPLSHNTMVAVGPLTELAAGS